MSTTTPETSPDDTSDSPSETDQDLAAQLELLAAENNRLRELLAASQRTQYRDTALALGAVGVVCIIGGFVAPTAETVLFALGGVGIFGGVLTYFLTPTQFISADIGEQVYTSAAVTYEQLCSMLGLSDRRLYVPAEQTDASPTQAQAPPGWLFVPQDPDTAPPEPSALSLGLIVSESHRGLAVRPTGSGLFSSFYTTLTEPVGTTPSVLCEQLSDALVEDFELVESVDYDLDRTDGRISMTFTNPLYGDGTRFDHPVVSFVATGVATGLQTPVDITVTEADPLSVTCRWETETTPDADGEE